MKVEILDCTPDFLRVIWTAARTCYSQLSPLELWARQPSGEEMTRLARNIIQSGHLSVVEHCHVTFGIAGVSRTLLAQYSRHRVGVSLSVQSQRYVSEFSEKNGGLFEHVIPPVVAGNTEAVEEIKKAFQDIQSTYDHLVALGIRKEDARFVLPGAAGTNFLTTLNLRSLMDIYQKRVITPGAQWEIRDMLREMARQVVVREPWLAEYLPLQMEKGA